MYGIFTYIYNKHQPNVGILYMDPMGYYLTNTFNHYLECIAQTRTAKN